MPKVPKSKPGKKHSPNTKGKLRAPKTRTKNKKSSSKAKNTVDTFQAWIDNQTKLRKHSPSVMSSEPTKMPLDSMGEWLAKQTIVEKEKPIEVRFPLGSTDEWLQTQVSLRLSKEKAELAESVVTVGSPSTTETAQVSVSAT